MKVEYKISSNMVVYIEGDDFRKLFEDIHAINDGLKPEPCGKCGDPSVHVVRESGGNKFYELRCVKCSARLSYGVEKETGKLYKKRAKTDDKGKTVKEDGKTVYLPDKGWQKWDAVKKQNV
jgi:hypothetical protein